VTVRWLAEAAVLIASAMVVASAAHEVGRSAERRAQLRRVVLHRAFSWAAVGLVGGGTVLLLLSPRPRGMPQRYADYLSDGGTDVLSWLSWVLAALLVGGGVLLLSIWLRLRNGSTRGGRRPGRHAVAAAGVLLLAAGLGIGWTADTSQPGSYGWFAYAPLGTQPEISGPYGARQRTEQAVAATLGLLGLGALTALAGFRTGRRESTGPDQA
jgi:heme/copper-type cytochrome/quinol oxidase subunit 1